MLAVGALLYGWMAACHACTTKVRQWVNKGGKLKVGGDVLVGLKRWETLVPKTPEVDKLLANMPEASPETSKTKKLRTTLLC